MDNTPFGINDKPAKVAGLKRHKKMISIIAVVIVTLVFLCGVATYGAYNGWYSRGSSSDKPSDSQEKLDFPNSSQDSSSGPNSNTKSSTDKNTDSKSQNGATKKTSSSSSATSKTNAAPDSPAPKPKPTPASPVVRKPLLIKHGWDIPTTSWAAGKVASMDKMPFDGVVMSMPDGRSSSVQRQSAVSYDTYKSALTPIAGANFKNLKHNFLIIYSTPAGDLFDDWSTPVGNYANVAKAANEAGLTGIFFDNEQYFGDAMFYPENCSSGKTVSQCRNQAQLRGTQIVNAIRSNWPDVKILVAHGPYISESKTAAYLNSRGIRWNDIAWANQLQGSFTVGMAAATVDTSAQYIDGGQVYAARTSQNFKDIQYWQKQGMAAQSSIIPDYLRSGWAGNVSSSFGVYDQSGLASGTSGTPMDPTIWRSSLTHALSNADHYVWAYTERYDWWGTGWPTTTVPNAWVTATRDAHNATR